MLPNLATSRWKDGFVLSAHECFQLTARVEDKVSYELKLSCVWRTFQLRFCIPVISSGDSTKLHARCFKLEKIASWLLYRYPI